MELAQVHSMMPLTVEDVARRLRAEIPTAALDPRALLGVAVGGPWRPADVFPGALERLAWTARFTLPEDRFLKEAAADKLGRQGFARRLAPIHPGELYLRALGEGVFTLVSDAARRAYVAVYRERQLRWSLLLDDRVRLVRCDGEVVQVDEPPEWFPEGDRTGVVLAGLYQWLREPIEVDAVDRYVLIELLDQLTGAPAWIVEDGAWDAPEPTRVAVAR